VFLAALVVLSACVAHGATAHAADRVYWATFVKDTISFANLDGSGGTSDLNTTGATVDEPIGLAIDPVGGRVYWANHTGGKISSASLDGSGGEDLKTGAATVSGPIGVAIDVVARRVYWANESGKISYANLDGSGGADLNTGAASLANPAGIAVNPAGGRVYWSNFGGIGGDSIAYANLDGSGGATLPIAGATLDTPLGVAIDTAAGRIYWANDNPGVISYANLDGSGSADLDVSGLAVGNPYGLAIDPDAGRVYWGNTTGDTIPFARLDGTGGATVPIAVEKGSGVNFPALLETPRGTGKPGFTRTRLVRKALKSRSPERFTAVRLSCTPGTWAPDLVESFLYRAPLSTSTQWTMDGRDLPAASEPFTVTEVGNYRCRETATNRAGSASQLSPVAALFKVGRAKLNRRKGIARLPVELPAGGVLTLAGRGVVGRETQAAGKRKLRVKPRGKKKARLASKGRVKVKVKLTFTPTDGPPVSQRVPIALRKRIPH
jgi:hypothetical protein